MASVYDFALTNGTPLVSIPSLENNGPGSLSTPRQILDIGFNGGANYFVINDNSMAARWMPPNATGQSISIINSPYAGTYTVSTAYGVDNTTHINVTTPINIQPVTIIGVTGNVWTISGIDGGACAFPPSSTLTVQGNTHAPANAVYTVVSASSSQPCNIIGIVTGANGVVTVVGNQSSIFITGQQFTISANTIVGDGIYTISSVLVSGGNTLITVLGTIGTGTTMSGLATPTPSVTNVTVASIPSGTTLTGSIVLPAITAHAFVAPATVISTTTGNYDVTLKIAGNIASQFVPGCQFIIRDNSFTAYRQLSILSSAYIAPSLSYPLGVTTVTTTVSSANVPVVDMLGALVFPVPAMPYGHIQYVTPSNSSLELVGRGSPYYNTTTTWGQALQNNQVHMLENFANSTPPSNPLAGQFWYDTTASMVHMYNGTIWTSFSGATTLTSSDVTSALTYTPANLVSPTFTGTPHAPTAAIGTNTTQIATTAFVMSQVGSLVAGVSSFNTRTGVVTLTSSDVTTALTYTPANLVSPTFTGAPTAPTATPGTNTTQIATTAFVSNIVTTYSPLIPRTVADTSGIATVNINTVEVYTNTSLSQPLLFAAPIGTAHESQPLLCVIKDNGAAQALTYNAIFVSRGSTLPTTTVSNKYLRLGFLYNSTSATWDLVGLAQEA